MKAIDILSIIKKKKLQKWKNQIKKKITNVKYCWRLEKYWKQMKNIECKEKKNTQKMQHVLIDKTLKC